MIKSVIPAKPKLINATDDNDVINASRYENGMVINGFSGNDLITGSLKDDVIDGGAGNDFIFSDKGNDRVYGGTGQDLIYGGTGNDTLYGGADNDDLFGDDGNDVISGDDGFDNIYGGKGNDYLTGGNGDDVIVGGAGDDRVFGGAGEDLIIGGEGNDTLYGEAGDDTFVFQLNGSSQDLLTGTINGGEGYDTIDLTQMDASGLTIYNVEAVTLSGDVRLTSDQLKHFSKISSLAAEGATIGAVTAGTYDLSAAGVKVEGIVNLLGSNGDDILIGNGKSQYLNGNNGNDQLYGNGGNDTLRGDNGNDVLSGGTGADWLYGGADDDMLQGDEGNDRLYGEDGSDTLKGGLGNDYLNGGNGSDLYVSNFGEGDDVIDETGNDYSKDRLLLNGVSSVYIEKSNNDLLLTLNDSSDHQGGTVRIKGWFSSKNNQIETIKLADQPSHSSLVLTNTMINNMLNGMAVMGTSTSSMAKPVIHYEGDASLVAVGHI